MKHLFFAILAAAGLFACTPTPVLAQTAAKPKIGGCGGWSTALSKDKARLIARRACFAQVGPIAAVEIAKIDAALAKLAPVTSALTPIPAPIREYAGQPLSQTPKRHAVLEMAPAR